MAAVSWAVCVRLLLVALAVLVPVPTSSQKPPTRKITDPGFPCGVPWGPNGERPTEATRQKRQIIFPDDKNYNKHVKKNKTSGRIIFPDDKNYQKYLARLMTKGSIIDPRNPSSGPTRPPAGPVKPVTEAPPTLPSEPEPLEDAFCGAAVISDRFIVTAAHCALDEEFPITSVRLGDLDLSTEDEANSKARDYDILEIIIHPNFRHNTTERYNDLALLLTYDTIQFNDVVFPFCIPADPPAPGDIVTASGFGLYNATTQSSHLLEANFTVLGQRHCEDEYKKYEQEAALRVKYPKLLQDTDIICAIDDVSDACQGDSGGPVIQVRNGKEYLVGIVAAGPSCRGNNKSVLPGLYLSLAHHVDFISDRVFREIPPPEF